MPHRDSPLMETCPPGLPREAYLDRYVGFMRREWTRLSAVHLEEACAHVRAHDHPATCVELTSMARAAGLDRFEVVARHGPHHTLRFGRSVAAA